MVQRVRIPHRGTSPSSVTQLPILTALHARFPTLFVPIIHYLPKKVNTYFFQLACFPAIHFVPGLFVYCDELSSQTPLKTLAFCAIFLYNGFNYGGKEGSAWEN